MFRLLVDLDTAVQEWMRKVGVAGGIINVCTVMIAGGIVNVHIVMTAAHGIVRKHNQKKLQECGGNIKITKTWAQSLL